LEAIHRIYGEKEIIGVVYIVLLLLWAVANTIDGRRFKSFVRLGVSSLYISTYKENISYRFQFVLSATGILSWGLLLWHLAVWYEQGSYEWRAYLKYVLWIFIYLLFRYSLEYVLAALFDLQNEFKQSVFVRMSYWNVSGMYLSVLLMFQFYTFPHSTVYTGFIIVTAVLMLVLIYYHFIDAYKNIVVSGLFYFILYFCTLEIAPVIWVLSRVIN